MSNKTRYNVKFQTEWDDGVTIETKAVLDIKNGFVDDIEVNENVDGLDILVGQKIIIGKNEYNVEVDDDDQYYISPADLEDITNRIKYEIDTSSMEM